MAAYETAAVATDQAMASKIGAHVLRELNGTAADAAVAVALSLGVINFQSSGLGGGGFLVYYDNSAKESTAINFREKAPSGAYDSMYYDVVAERPALLVGVPGELKGLERLWKKYGRVEWQKLFDLAANVAETGFAVTNWTERALGMKKEDQFTDELKTFLMPNEKRFIAENDWFSAPRLGATLRRIGAHGNSDIFYKGQMARDMVEELNAAGGVFAYDDFAAYDVEETETIKTHFMDMTVCGAPPPCGSAITQYLLNILSTIGEEATNFDADTRHYIAEAFKFAFAARMRFGDAPEAKAYAVERLLTTMEAERVKVKIDKTTTHAPDYYDAFYALSNDDGTTHFSIVDTHGNAVALTTTIENYFGSQIYSESLGFLYNSTVLNFARPDKYDPVYNLAPNPINYVRAGKRSQSSTSPLVFIDQKGDVVAVVGASGSHMIITSVVLTLVKYFAFGYSLADAVREPRFHHQLAPNYVCVQEDFPDEWRRDFERRGHVVECVPRRLAAVQAIVKENGKFVAVCDYRKMGEPDGF